MPISLGSVELKFAVCKFNLILICYCVCVHIYLFIHSFTYIVEVLLIPPISPPLASVTQPLPTPPGLNHPIVHVNGLSI